MDKRREALEAPAAELARALQESGRADLGAYLTEVLPTGEIPNDDHLPLLRERLTRIAGLADLTGTSRQRAADLVVVATDLPAAIGRTGTAWLGWWSLTERARRLGTPDEEPYYMCHWDGQPEASGLLEYGPDLAELDAALAWAQARARRIMVRPSWDPDVYYWAGEDPPPDGIPLLREPRRR
jgi:hypothetical protein